MVARGLFAHRLIGFPPPPIQRFLRRALGDETIAARADQVLSSGLLERFAHLEIVFRFEELHQRPLQFAVA